MLNIVENVLGFLSYAQGQVNANYFNSIYGLDSGFTVALNGVCLMEIVYQKRWQRGMISLTLLVIYALFGFPYIFVLLYSSDYETPIGIWMNTYFNSISYPVWQIFCYAFDPITAGIIIFYIIKKSLDEIDNDIGNRVFIRQYSILDVTNFTFFMPLIEAADALFAIQSQWLHSDCKFAPELIIGSIDVYATIPFSSLVVSGPGYCGNEWIKDCTHPGICAASLDLEMTFGYSSFQTSYLYFIPSSPAGWLYPIDAKGKTYCQISSVNATDLLLAGSAVCYDSFQCTQDANLLVFNDSTCQFLNQSHRLDSPLSNIQIGGETFNFTRFTVLNATEKVVWTTFITSQSTPLQRGEQLWILALFLLVISLVLTIVHAIIALAMIFRHKGTRRFIYMVYFLGFILSVCDNVTSFLAYADGLFNTGYNGILYGLDSGINLALNGVCLMEIVFKETWQRVLISIALIIIYGMFGLPYLFYMLFEFDYTSSFGIWINGYFNSVGFPGWQIIAMAFDPLTAGIIIVFIIQKSLCQLKINILSVLWILCTDSHLVCLTVVSFFNFAICTFLELATTYTFFAQNDKIMNVYQDIYDLNDKEKSENVSHYFSEFWEAIGPYLKGELKERPLIIREIFKHVGFLFFLASLAKALNLVFTILTPLLIGTIISFLLQGESMVFLGINISNPIIIAALMFVFQMGSSVSDYCVTSLLLSIKLRIRAAFIGAIYKKNLRLSSPARKEFNEGHIMVLINKDVGAFGIFFTAITNAWSTPIQLGLVIYFLAKEIGITVITPIIITIVFQLVQSKYSIQLGGYFGEWMECNDVRMQRIREFLYGIKIIKFRAIEGYFSNQIDQARNSELAVLKKINNMMVLDAVFLRVQWAIITPGTFLVYALLGNSMETWTIFTALGFLSSFNSIVSTLNNLFITVPNGLASWRRLEKFMFATEHFDQQDQLDGEKSAIRMINSTFEYEKEETQSAFRLENLDLKISKGFHYGLVGSVGAGKSSLFSAVLGDIPKISGKYKVNGSISVVEQKPFILAGTIKENIILQQEYEKAKLDTILHICCLDADLLQLSKGINTYIGEKGVTLSGGQMLRVSVARALYKESDIYLFDDVTSALDAKVAAVMLKRLLKYLKGKSIIFATNSLHFLPAFDSIIVLEKGRIVEQGSYANLIHNSGALAEKVQDLKIVEFELENESFDVEPIPEKEVEEEPIVKEERITGSVKLKYFFSYLAATKSPVTGITCCISLVLYGVAQFLTPVWLEWWTTNKFNLSTATNLSVYVSFGLGSGLAQLFMQYMVFAACMVASIYYHKDAIEGLMKAPMSFFDQQPIGRILSRLENDMFEVDVELAQSFLPFAYSLMQFIASFLILVYSLPILLVLFSVVAVVSILIYRVYQPANLELKRVSSILKSPLNAHISESLAGSNTIKLFGSEEYFLSKLHAKMDQSTVRIYLALCKYVVRYPLGVALLDFTKVFDSNSIGAALISALGLNGALNAVLSTACSLETSFNSVERLDHYIHELPKEDQNKIAVEESWPQQGEIEIIDLTVRYPSRPDYSVLENISLKVRAGEKVGIVGRTGSGKSSLITTLFRLIEPHHGNIKIDQKDIRTVDLQTLRSKITMIPQDPVIFQGTLRSNIDLFEKYTDNEIWRVLEAVGLKELCSNNEQKLNMEISANGENMSAGEKQLVYLAIALLENPRILVLDEATAAIDYETDQKIQKILNTEFKNTTILSIAHRINTISGFDKVLVLKDGKMVEYESPYILSQNPNSEFYKLANSAQN
ncbi:Canalicular multispecific organic anion transporter 2 [Boothiomyces sp. JEL0866]|nr:Canalicular multispecific organic anion transporter 2 [Boothiomyces sp. JEL0866]